jgi:hypothetical protein
MIEAYKEMIANLRNFPKSLPSGTDWYLNTPTYMEVCRYGEVFGVTLFPELRTFVSISISKPEDGQILTLRWAGVLSHIQPTAPESTLREELSFPEMFLLTQFKIENLVDANYISLKSIMPNRIPIEL